MNRKIEIIDEALKRLLMHDCLCEKAREVIREIIKKGKK